MREMVEGVQTVCGNLAFRRQWANHVAVQLRLLVHHPGGHEYAVGWNVLAAEDDAVTKVAGMRSHRP